LVINVGRIIFFACGRGAKGFFQLEKHACFGNVLLHMIEHILAWLAGIIIAVISATGYLGIVALMAI